MYDAVTSLNERRNRITVGQVGLNNLFMRYCCTKVGNVGHTHRLGKMAKVLPAMRAKRTGGTGDQKSFQHVSAFIIFAALSQILPMPRRRSDFGIIPCEQHCLAVGPFSLKTIAAGCEPLQVGRVSQAVLNDVPGHGPACFL